jgi:hypothetical protein
MFDIRETDSGLLASWRAPADRGQLLPDLGTILGRGCLKSFFATDPELG